MLKRPTQHPTNPLPRPGQFSLFEKPAAPETVPLPAPSYGGVVASRVQAQLYGEKPKAKKAFGEEQRRSTRAKVDIMADYTIGDKRPRPAHVSDLSNSGLQLITEEPVLVGTRIDITFNPVDAFKSSRVDGAAAITIEGRVMRSATLRRGQSGFAHGIAFSPGHPHSEIIRLTVIQVSLEAGAASLNSLDPVERHYVARR